MQEENGRSIWINYLFTIKKRERRRKIYECHLSYSFYAFVMVKESNTVWFAA
jgi:hypothetical protein